MCGPHIRAAERDAGRAMMLDKAQQHLVLLHALAVGLSVEQGFRAEDVETYLDEMRVVGGRPEPLLRDHPADHDAAAQGRRLVVFAGAAEFLHELDDWPD